MPGSRTPPVFEVKTAAIIPREDHLALQITTQADLAFEFRFEHEQFFRLFAAWVTQGFKNEFRDPHRPPGPSD